MKTDARTFAPATQEQIRFKAVAAVEKGMTRVKAAEVFGVTRQSVDRWVKAYRSGGANALKVHKRGPKGEGSRLAGWQAATIIKLITDHHPEQLTRRVGEGGVFKAALVCCGVVIGSPESVFGAGGEE